VLGNAEELPFEDESFDTVVCTDVLEHLEHPERVVAEMRRVLKEDGELIVMVPSQSPLWKLRWILSRTALREPFHNHYTRKQLVKLLGNVKIRSCCLGLENLCIGKKE